MQINFIPPNLKIWLYPTSPLPPLLNPLNKNFQRTSPLHLPHWFYVFIPPSGNPFRGWKKFKNWCRVTFRRQFLQSTEFLFLLSIEILITGRLFQESCGIFLLLKFSTKFCSNLNLIEIWWSNKLNCISYNKNQKWKGYPHSLKSDEIKN